MVETSEPTRHNLVMEEHDRPRLHMLLTLYAFLALAWIAFARSVVPPLLIAEHSPGILASLKRYIELPPALFITRDILGRWREYSWAVLIAIVLHMTILLILRRYDLRAVETRPAPVLRAERRVSLALFFISSVFLGVTALSGPRHDYYFYRQMWYEIERGHDPWFKIYGLDGHVPLNAYGPVFNLLTGLSWINPYAPKLMFAYSYTLFAISQIKGFTASRAPSSIQSMVLLALFWNPFPWVEIAVRGHFDILVGLFCLGAIRAWTRGYDIGSGVCLALGVLLKYQPIVLLPVLALDRGRARRRFLVAALGTIAFGMGLSCLVWGTSTLSPLELAATRNAKPLSIFFFVRGHYSPFQLFGVRADFDDLAPFVLFLALLAAWAWAWVRRPDALTGAVVAAVTTVLFYRTAYPQYQMVSFVLGSSWAVRHWDRIRGRTARVIAISCYFGWLGAFDLYYAFDDEGPGSRYWHTVQYVVGLPSFLCGCAFLAGVIRSATPDDEARIQRPESKASGADKTG
jgi:Glycosyltransferase family 87